MLNLNRMDKEQGHFAEYQPWRGHELCQAFNNNNQLYLARCCSIVDHLRSLTLPRHFPTGECFPLGRSRNRETFPVPASAARATGLAPTHKTEMVIGCLDLLICTLNLEANMGYQMKISIVLDDATKTCGRMILKPVPSCPTSSPSILTFPNLFHSRRTNLEKDLLLLDVAFHCLARSIIPVQPITFHAK
jgi:hypothetical protein